MSILSDEEAFGNISEKCRKGYRAVWNDFKDFNSQSSSEFDSRFPNEKELMDYFKKLRQVNKFKFSTLWTKYSTINSVVKAKYSRKLQDYPRLTSYLKTFNGVDEKKKSDIFSSEELNAFISSPELDDAYWLVRKAVVILAYYGGLRHNEVMNLELQNFSSAIEGVYVIHTPGKQ